VDEVVRPALEAGKTVVSDRFLDSSLAYQGIARGLGLDEIYRMSEWATKGVVPDLVFLLSVDPEEGLRRAGTDRDRLEQERGGFHARVALAYSELATRYPKRFVVVDASASPEEVHRSIVTAFEQRAPGRTAGAGGEGQQGVPR
jgi:dTMP kinase